MRCEFEIGGGREVVEIDQVDGKLRASVGERTYDLQMTSPESEVYLLFLGDKVFEARVSLLDPHSYQIHIGGRSFSAKLVERKGIRSPGEHVGDGEQYLTAPMPGKVVKVLHQCGEEIDAGQGVVVVEAMKMQNEVKAPRPGRITEIRVKEGMTVTANQV
ncbi:MAG TPA: biotin/lipoyl-containing protein, partial [Blastocatellia bacterium]|nr:biotin/lipoyl-containing protein [Blastocatellia bacterium]